MSSIFSAADQDALARPHVARAWLVSLDLPGGWVYLHSGVGRVNVAGQTWRGVTDPSVPGRLLSIGTIKEPRFGQAAAITFTLGGVTADFMRSLRLNSVEGRTANVYWCAFDAETQQVIIQPTLLFPFGRMTSPSRRAEGIGTRTVSLTIESIWSSMNYPSGDRWTYGDQLRRYPGDQGLQFVGVDILEQWK